MENENGDFTILGPKTPTSHATVATPPAYRSSPTPWKKKARRKRQKQKQKICTPTRQVNITPDDNFVTSATPLTQPLPDDKLEDLPDLIEQGGVDDAEEKDDDDIVSPVLTAPPTAAPPNHVEIPPKSLSPTMAKMHTVFGDHPCLDTGEDQSGGVEDDEVWQEQWRQLIVLTPQYYHLPSGKVGK